MKNQTDINSSNVRKPIQQLYLGLLFLLIAIIAVLLIKFLPDNTSKEKALQNSYHFQKQGTAVFYNLDGKPVYNFETEIADTPDKLKTGLMYRDSLAVNQAMLFLFENEEPRSFWMKNTYLPLDIIYISADSLIVSISENTIPFSEENVTSTGPAKYVLEVNAGLAKSLGLKPGLKFFWTRD